MCKAKCENQCGRCKGGDKKPILNGIGEDNRNLPWQSGPEDEDNVVFTVEPEPEEDDDDDELTQEEIDEIISRINSNNPKLTLEEIKAILDI